MTTSGIYFADGMRVAKAERVSTKALECCELLFFFFPPVCDTRSWYEWTGKGSLGFQEVGETKDLQSAGRIGGLYRLCHRYSFYARLILVYFAVPSIFLHFLLPLLAQVANVPRWFIYMFVIVVRPDCLTLWIFCSSLSRKWTCAFENGYRHVKTE